MVAVKLAAQRREDHTKSATKQIRNSGRVPAVIYGKAKEAKSIAVNSVELIKTVRDEGRNAIISLHIEDEKPVDVMLHDYQIDPIRDELVHADFYIVDMAEEMDVEVNLRLEGEAKGTKDGGVLQQPLYQLQVRAKPADIPEEIVVDVSDLGIGDSIAVSDITIKGNFEILDEAVTTVATVLAPDTLEDVEEAPSENAEPELVDAEKE
ncbi:50S ribosomal protein L25/general stress protein Ctc [Roseburia sp. 1XD42-34]|uniref:50S ribosomal protein L25/general stress protein Ctc n=1 Tax=Roseburia sp. 1XD42-34 TaxID=2305905 RepID=UPI0018F2969C|nr:50S ribosomal protein L25/general stress protein Ctc [Roseburia sp. 1XD42-34]